MVGDRGARGERRQERARRSHGGHAAVSHDEQPVLEVLVGPRGLPGVAGVAEEVEDARREAPHSPRAPPRAHAASTARSESVIPVRLAIGMVFVTTAAWWMRGAATRMPVGGVEQHPGRGPHEPRLRRALGVAARAALPDDRLHPREARRVARRGRGLSGGPPAGRQRRRQAHQQQRRDGRQRGSRPARLAEHEEPADQHAGRADHRQHGPGVRVAVGHRIVAADHDEHDRQREVGVVHAALLAHDAGARIGRPSRPDRRHHLPLARDDVEEHVPDHDGPDHRPDVKVRRARAEHPPVAPGRGHGQEVDDDRASTRSRVTSRHSAS